MGYASLANPEAGRESHPPRKEIFDFYKILWHLDIPPKWRTFLWKLAVNGILVKANLRARGIITDTLCDYCGLKEEDGFHLLLDCSIARQDGIQSNRIQAFVATLWAIWITRNKRVFQGENGYLRCYFGNLKEVSLGQLNHVLLFNDSLALGTIRADGSWHKASKHYVVGWTIELRSRGEREAGGNSGIAVSTLQTEFWACLYALRWARDNGYRSIKILTDSALLVTSLKKKGPSDIHLFWTWKEIIKIESTFQHCIILKVDRAEVSLTHHIANHCRVTLNSFSIPAVFDVF
ncbi:uncharacterized protein LOC110707574 [Chenopodium quinoa]|uniref:uncharacterized protein LOC110707574 n=1 Tax=Chenopodium quinoa TaxID=63459 RepID=UPI000B78ED91|nr:uncharacterized protein LOC110707574 [Chenopodium quinoa]